MPWGQVPMPKLLAELEKMVMSSGLLPSQLSVMMSLIGVHRLGDLSPYLRVKTSAGSLPACRVKIYSVKITLK